MSLPIVLRPDTETDLQSAREWYETQRTGLGDAFTAAVDHFFARIQAFPESYATVQAKVRRGKLKRFPYVVYYRVHPDRLEVIAILHGSRHPQTWQDRV